MMNRWSGMDILIVCVCVSMIGGTYVGGRSATDGNLPCSLNFLPPDYYETYYTALQAVRQQIYDLRQRIETHIEYMENTPYCMDSARDSFMYFLRLPFTDVGNQMFLFDFFYDEASFLQKMKEHYEMLNLLYNYFESRKQTTNDDDEFARNSLGEIQIAVYDVMCAIKGVLHDSVAFVPGGNLSFNMQYLRGITICHHQRAEYAIVLDSKTIERYLESMYTTVIAYLTECS